MAVFDLCHIPIFHHRIIQLCHIVLVWLSVGSTFRFWRWNMSNCEIYIWPELHSTVKYFWKKFHIRCLTGFWIHLKMTELSRSKNHLCLKNITNVSFSCTCLQHDLRRILEEDVKQTETHTNEFQKMILSLWWKCFY